MQIAYFVRQEVLILFIPDSFHCIAVSLAGSRLGRESEIWIKLFLLFFLMLLNFLLEILCGRSFDV